MENIEERVKILEEEVKFLRNYIEDNRDFIKSTTETAETMTTAMKVITEFMKTTMNDIQDLRDTYVQGGKLNQLTRDSVELISKRVTILQETIELMQ